ncbi:hypothetical protein EAG_15242 [Camponotus floridanus]|uniref:Uncharacterized protein n=1 Tax=Camponotus floridanus TaxID=104421 RepID=E2A084_CAMFO|nr:hypothetical protein EAG_15242 [Camponotus floridanus]
MPTAFPKCNAQFFAATSARRVACDEGTSDSEDLDEADGQEQHARALSNASRGLQSGHRLDSGSPFWRIQLDQDLLDTISAIYPEWFKDYTNSRAASTSSPTSSGASSAQSCDENAAVVVVERGGEHKIAKGDAKSRSKVKKADGHKDKDRDRKDPRRDAKDERDTGNGKKGTKPSPQQDKAAADAAGRKAAGAAAPESGSEMAEGNQSPPKAEVDDSPLQHAMDRNKECEYKSVIGSDRILISYEHTLSRHSPFTGYAKDAHHSMIVTQHVPTDPQWMTGGPPGKPSAWCELRRRIVPCLVPFIVFVPAIFACNMSRPCIHRALQHETPDTSDVRWNNIAASRELGT